MVYSEDKIRLTVAVDEELNRRIELIAAGFGKSKTKLIIDLIESNIYNYIKVWETVQNKTRLSEMIADYKKVNKDVSDLLKIQKVLLTEPRTVERVSRLMKELKEEQKSRKKK